VSPEHLARLDGIEAKLAAVTEEALAAMGDAVVAQRRLQVEMVRLVVVGCIATVAVTAALCLAALVLLLHSNHL
jgi:hypothetical protein